MSLLFKSVETCNIKMSKINNYMSLKCVLKKGRTKQQWIYFYGSLFNNFTHRCSELQPQKSNISIEIVLVLPTYILTVSSKKNFKIFFKTYFLISDSVKQFSRISQFRHALITSHLWINTIWIITVRPNTTQAPCIPYLYHRPSQQTTLQQSPLQHSRTHSQPTTRPS